MTRQLPTLPTGPIAVTVIALVAMWGLVVLWMWWRQEDLVYFPAAHVRTNPADVGLDYEPLTLATSDGERLAAWWVPAEGTARAAVLYCHGNAGNIGDRVGVLRWLHGLRVDVLIFDYRGYGNSTGTPSEPGLYADVEAAWEELTERRAIPSDRIVLYGRSLGAAVAARHAAHSEPAGLVLDSPFRSVPEMGATVYPWLPVRTLARLSFSTEDWLTRSDVPVLLLHGRDDATVPPEQSEVLAAQLGTRGTLVWLPGGHNAAPAARGAAATDALDAFIERTVGGRASTAEPDGVTP